MLEAVAAKHRDRRSALKMLKKLMKRHGCAVEIVTATAADPEHWQAEPVMVGKAAAGG